MGQLLFKSESFRQKDPVVSIGTAQNSTFKEYKVYETKLYI